MSADTLLVGVAELTGRVTAILRAFGCAPEVAAEVAGHLVRAEASGHVSHGILRLPQYRQEIARGTIRPQAHPRVLKDAGATILLDAQHCFGHYSTAVAADLVGDRALAHGVAVVAVRGTTHIGRLGDYTERLNGRGLVSIISVGAAGPGIGAMAPFGTTAGPFLNSNPFAFGFPVDEGDGFVFDASMSNIAEGKVHAARDRGERLPEGAILDAAARPTTDPADYYTGGTLTPLGGALAGHKGYGLALAAALLGGLAHADGSRPDVTGIASTAGATDGSPRIGGVALIAINPAGFAQDLGYAHLVGGVLASFHDAGAVIPGEFEAARRGAFTGVQLEQRAVNTLRELEADLLSEDLSSVRRRSRRGSALSWWRRDG